MALVDASLGLSAAWYGAEFLGTLVGRKEDASSSTSEVRKPRISREEMKAGILEDYEHCYFVGGSADMAVYEDDCEFADKFSSYRGLGRFQKNISAFGKLTCAL